ncbi:MAG TPA: hypothetical protein V6C65_13875 [Allocoleopsis sp.]
MTKVKSKKAKSSVKDNEEMSDLHFQNSPEELGKHGHKTLLFDCLERRLADFKQSIRELGKEHGALVAVEVMFKFVE